MPGALSGRFLHLIFFLTKLNATNGEVETEVSLPVKDLKQVKEVME